MDIVINGETRDLPVGVTVSELVNDLGFGDKRVAVEVNQEIVPRSEHPAFQLQPGDRVEVVAAIGGG